MRGENSCGHGTLGFRCKSLWGHELCEGCAEIGVELHADPPTGAFGGAPYGATNRARGAAPTMTMVMIMMMWMMMMAMVLMMMMMMTTMGGGGGGGEEE